MICPYCKYPAPLVDSSAVYGRSYGPIYLCKPCDAYVGCHKGTEQPLGTLANRETREARKAAHAAFDPLWEAAPSLYTKISRHKAWRIGRGRAYRWLAAQLGVEEVHIGESDADRCERIVILCSDATASDIRAWAKEQKENAQRGKL